MPVHRRRRFRVAGTALALFLLSCGKTVQDNAATTNGDANAAAPVSRVAETPLLDRAGLLLVINQAASAFAAGSDDRDTQNQLDGRQFSVRLPFACAGPVPSGSRDPLRMTLRPDGKSVEISAMPTIGMDNVQFESADGAPGTAVRAVEGFWIDWPWLTLEQCPPAAQLLPIDPFMTMRASDTDNELPVAPPPVERTAGVAQFFSDTDSRLGSRSGRDYRRVVPLREGQAPPKGLFLLIEGRLRHWPDGKVIRCSATVPGARPSCIAGAAIDRVAIERADDKTILGEWTSN